MKQFIKKIPFLYHPAQRVNQFVRTQKRKRLFKRIRNISPLRLVIGASGIYEKGWIETEIQYLNLLNPSQWETYFNKDSIDAMLAEHVWEHLTLEEGMEAARRCFEYLKPGGYIRVAVPDGNNPKQEYIAAVRPGGTGEGASDHKLLYNYQSFSEVFSRAGFRVVLLEYFDSEGNFHYIDWNPQEGKIRRSRRFDPRNQDGKLNYTSLILDAIKDA